MIGIGKNRYKTLVTITAVASVLIINAITTGTDGHIALARHHDNTKVFENNIPFLFSFPIDTHQRQACTTAGGTSPISDSCTASSSDTVSRGTASPSCPTIHPTALTLTISPTTVGVSQHVTLTGTLADTCTGSGLTDIIPNPETRDSIDSRNYNYLPQNNLLNIVYLLKYCIGAYIFIFAFATLEFYKPSRHIMVSHATQVLLICDRNIIIQQLFRNIIKYKNQISFN
jgi:hypothetical protein